MTLAYDTDGVKLYNGDCLQIMSQLEDDSIDSIITDPPYSLSSIKDANQRISVGLNTDFNTIANQERDYFFCNNLTMASKETDPNTDQQLTEDKIITIGGKKYRISPVHPDLLRAARESNKRFFAELDRQQQLFTQIQNPVIVDTQEKDKTEEKSE